jgi:hypothetical protein
MKKNVLPVSALVVGTFLILLSYLFRLTHWPGVRGLIITGLILIVPSLISLIRNRNEE